MPKTASDRVLRSSRHRVAFLVVVAVVWLLLAAWEMATGDVFAAIGNVLVAVLAVLAAFVVSDPDRPRATLIRMLVAVVVLVPLTLAAFALSMFL